MIGFDFGTARLGVAVGNTLTATASPLTVIRATQRSEQLRQAQELLKHWEAAEFVVGCPRHADGREHETALQAARFARQLSAASRKPFHLVDETLSSAVVQDRRAPDGSDDAAAAAVILQQFFDEFQR